MDTLAKGTQAGLDGLLKKKKKEEWGRKVNMIKIHDKISKS
jgi:hypothetical protein